MNSRKKPADKDAARQLRTELYAAIDLGELSVQETVKLMRKISRLTQPEFAARVGVSAKVIKEIERGIGNPTSATLNQIGQFFGLEVAFVRSEKIHGVPRASASSAHMATPGTSIELSRSMDDILRRLSHLESIKETMQEAQQIIDMAESIRRLGQPSPALTQMLASLEAAKKLLHPPELQQLKILEGLNNMLKGNS